MSGGPVQPPSGGEHDLAAILAEAEAEAQETPVVEPFSLRLRSGRVVVFRNPDDVSTEEWENAADGVSGRLRLLCADRSDFRALWREIKDLPPNRVTNLATTIYDYYEKAGKGKRSTST